MYHVHARFEHPPRCEYATSWRCSSSGGVCGAGTLVAVAGLGTLVGGVDCPSALGGPATGSPTTQGCLANVAASRFAFRSCLHGFGIDFGISFTIGFWTFFGGSWMFFAIGSTSL